MNTSTKMIRQAIVEFSEAWMNLSQILTEEANDEHLKAINMMDHPEMQWIDHCITETYLTEFRAWRDASLKNLESL